MFRNRSTNKKEARERVIIGEDIIDISVLRAEAKKAGTRFWVVLILVSLISSLAVPYLSMASIAASDTKVFTGDVIPGYSMGGISISAYGVDINSWGQSAKQSESNPAIVKSQYGYWTQKRAEDASSNLVASQRADRNDEKAALHDYAIDDEYMSPEKKARGWIGITRDDGEGNGLADFGATGSGEEISGRSHYSENVAPYRTQADWNFWDSQTVGGETPSMTATVYPDFVIFGWDAASKTARTLTNPDDIQNISSTDSKDSRNSGVIAGTAAVPHYVPLSTLFEEFGLGDTVMSDDPSKGMNDMDSLFSAIMEDARDHDGKSPILNKIVENKDNDPRYDLLIGTHYDNLNGANKSSESGSDAWNPYPYSMVFKGASGNSTVVSSIYNNTEAYVYFSPQSVYTNYMNLRSEYDDLVNASARQVADAEPQAAFQLGYYLAGMSILEAYLNEALPQDMTRGYVGPSEGNPLATSVRSLMNADKLNTRSGSKGSVSDLFAQSFGSVDNMVTEDGTRNDSAVGFRAVAYSQLMYDFADAAIVKYKAKGEGTWLGATSAIMNTLSTYGYGVRDSGQNTNTDKVSAGQGPNRGMTRRQQMTRITAFGPYTKSAESLNVSVSESDSKNDPFIHPDVTNVANTGFYVPVYYPIQQHEMSTNEMQYRFQVVSLIPYNTLAYEIGKHGFNNKVSMSYRNNAIATLNPTKDYYSKVASLGRQLDELNKMDGESLSGYDKGKSIVINPQTNATSMVGDKKTVDYARMKDTTERVDNALMSFQSGLMNADNVHDLVDVARAVPGVKYETFVRYYNPIKSSGGANDLFLTRVTPAQTTYMPAILTSGYESAGGVTNNESIKSTMKADFDYFSIPSFAPCFAAKTAEDTYYGALNYELRPFYTSGFLSTLPAGSNIPALESYEQVQDEVEEKTSLAMQGMKTKILTIYILAKRLAFATAYNKLQDAKKSDGFVSAGGLYYGDKSQSSISSGSDASDGAVQAALKPSDPGTYNVPENDNGKMSFSETKIAGEMPTSVEIVGSSDNKISTETLSDGTEFGISDDNTQVSVNSNVYEVDSNMRVTTAGAGATAQAQVDHAVAQKAADEEVERLAAEAAAAAAAGGGGWYGGEYDYAGLPSVSGGSASTGGKSGGTGDISRLRDIQNFINRVKEIQEQLITGGSKKPTYIGSYIASSPAPVHTLVTVTTASGNHGTFTNGTHSGYFVLTGFMSRLLDAISELVSPTVAYAAPSADAEKVYKDDKLESRGYVKGSASEWSSMKNGMTSAEGVTFHIPSGVEIPASGDFDYVMQEFGQKHILSDDVLTKKNIWCKTSNGLAFVTDLKTVFSGLYNDAYTHFLSPGEGDSYYWDVPAEIAKYDANVDSGQSALEGESSHYNTVAMPYSDAANVDKARQNLDGYCEEAFKEINAALIDLKMLNDDLPKQMQNVLAWADNQAASESEKNYQTSPDDQVLEIKLGVKETNNDQVPVLHNLYDAQRCGYQIYDNNGDYTLAESTSSESANIYDSGLQARVVRGVAGTTATPSERLAAYTISATVARIDRLAPASASSSSIPYAGIYTGNLNSGTDNYAKIQAHTIDRQAISSGLSGDLRDRGSSTAQVALANSSSDNATQQYLQAQSTFVNELQASVVPNSVDIMKGAMAQTMPSGSTNTQGIESVNASTSGIGFSSLLASPNGTQDAMAKASTFENATMNRPSSTTQLYDAGSGTMMYQSGDIATASASGIAQDRQFAEKLVNGSFSDAYAVIQSVALMMVLAFLMIIAFQNFAGYTSGNEADYISAQTKLKTVLPRTLIAMVMIGLPPMGGQPGFPGGCYLLLQILNALVESIVGSFTGGTDMFDQLMSNMVSAFTVDFDVLDLITKFFDILLDLVAAAVFLVGSLFVVLLCAATDIVLFVFWLIGPIVWAFYVWPYSASDVQASSGKKGVSGVMGKLTGYFGLKSFTNGAVGRDAPSGWVMGYLSVLSTLVIWNIMFWVFSIVLTMMRDGTSLTTAMSSLAHAEGTPPEIYNPGSAGDIIGGGAAQSIPNDSVGHLLLAFLFLGVVYVMFRVLKNNMGGAMKMMYGAVGFAAKVATTVALGHVAAAAKGADVASKANKAMDAAGKADSLLGKAVNVGAKGLDTTLHGIGALDNVVNSPAASDIGNRVNKAIDELSKDVADRSDEFLGGAFDGLVDVVDDIDEDGNVKGKKISVTPALAGIGDLKRRATQGYRDFRICHGKNKMNNRLTQLAAQDNDYQCLQQANGINERLAAMGGDASFDDFANDVRGHIASQGSMSDGERRQLQADAALLGVSASQLDSLSASPDLDKKFDRVTANARETYEQGVAIAADSEKTALVEKRHENAMMAREAIEARSAQIDRALGRQVAEQNKRLFDSGPATKKQLAARRAKTMAVGMAAQAGGVLASGAKAVNAVSEGGRLGDKSPKTKREREVATKSQIDHAGYDMSYERQRNQIRDMDELGRVAVRATEVMDHGNQDASLGEIAASIQSDNVAALDKLNEKLRS